MPGLHAKSPRAGTVHSDSIRQRGEQKGQIGVVRVAHKPCRLCRGKPFKIHIGENLTHQLPSAAGNHTVRLAGQKHSHDLPPALPGSVADSDALIRIAIGAQRQPVPHLLQLVLCIFKCRLIRLCGAAKGRRNKADGPALWQKFRISHFILPSNFRFRNPLPGFI